MKRYFALLLIIIIVGAGEAVAEISADEALSIAKREALYYDIDLSDDTVQIIRDETFEYYWTKKEKIHRGEDDDVISDSIRGSKFWAVCFFPIDRRTYDGVLSTYIDASDGKILGFEPMSPKQISEYRKKAKKEISVNQAISIADGLLKEKDINADSLTMSVIRSNMSFLKFLPFNNVFIRNGVDNLDKYQDYWLLYYRPSGDFETGDIGIVIDMNNGDVLEFIK